MRKVSACILIELFQVLIFFLENVRNGAAFRCIEAIGQAIAYGMNTQTTSNPLIGLYVLGSPNILGSLLTILPLAA